MLAKANERRKLCSIPEQNFSAKQSSKMHTQMLHLYLELCTWIGGVSYFMRPLQCSEIRTNIPIFFGLDSGTNRKQYSHTKLLMKSFRNKKLCQRRAEKNQRKVEIMKSASARASYESRCVVAKDSAIIYQMVGCPWDTNICIERVYYNYIQGAPSRAYRKME